MNVDEITIKFLASIQSKVSTALYNAWFKNMQIMDLDTATALLYIDSDFKKKKIIENDSYADIIEKTLKEVTGKDYTFELVTDFITNEMVNANQDVEQDYNKPIEVPIITEQDQESINTYTNEYKKINNNLNPELRFDNYVVGEANRTAQVVALEVAKNPGKTYNPFFLYGRSGTGKTHLMHAIGNYIVNNSDKTVLYIRSDQFISDFTEMTRKINNSDNSSLIEHFKDKYRNIDVLIIDDIQMLQDAKKSQSEFFQTFDSLYNLKKQIIISSDTSPNDLNMFEDRLKTRFGWGIALDIKPPDRDLKIKILKNKIIGMESADLIQEEVFDYIASNSPADIRSLEGAITRLFANIAIYQPETVDIPFTKEALGDIFGSNQYMTNDLARIRKTVAEYYDVTEESLKSKKRQANINKARQIGMYLSSILTEETVERIGLQYNRDHATVLHGVEKIEKELLNDDQLNKEIKELRDLLTI